MDHFTYRNGELFAEDVPLSRIAKDVGTPFYCYSSATISRHFTVFKDAFSGLNALVCYAMKANSNGAVLGTLARLGAGADVVSAGEMALAIKNGIKPENIVFSGVGKQAHELAAALDNRICQINVESAAELYVLNDIARQKGVKAPVALRVNPDVDAKTHAKISTGKKENKFGIHWDKAIALFHQAGEMDGIKLTGVDVHIGSQLLALDPFKKAFARVRELVTELKKSNISFTNIDVGGGLGIPYEKDYKTSDYNAPRPEDYAAIVKKTVGDLGCRIILEPGRLIVGNAGILAASVIYVKEGENRTYVIIDAAMNDLIRPALYDAVHTIRPAKEPDNKTQEMTADIVGPVCETGDTFAKDYRLAPVKAGDMIVMESAGAYGAVMSCTYNSRPLVPEVMVNGDQYAIIRKRPSLEEMTALEQLPPWLMD